MTQQLADINVWTNTLGLFPIPLFNDREREQPFVLLNGSQGNFCLDLGNTLLGTETRNYAWSANVGHYITLSENYVEVQRWDNKKSAIERYSTSSVAHNLERFHSYLENDSTRQDISIVAHAIRVFRSLRATLGSLATGPQSLKAFLYLLACATENVDRKNLRADLWQLDKEAFVIAEEIREHDWQALKKELEQGRPVESLIPNLRLLLRHASGQLFQEAHYEAVLINPGQLTLEGFLPSPVRIDRIQKARGIHFTPSALARTLIEQSLTSLDKDEDSIRIFDPACGSGEFLREVLRQLKLSQYKGKIDITGWDISPAACDMAKFVLAWESRDLLNNITIQIQCVDSLLQEWPQNIDLILMNPPFVSWQDLAASQREVLSQTLGNLSLRRPDMSHAFVLLATAALREGGILGTILPASVLDGYSAELIRQRLSELLSPKLIARLGSHLLFPSAMIDAALYVGKKGVNSREATVAFWADHRTTSNTAGLRALRKARQLDVPSSYPIVNEGYNIYLSSNLGKNAQSWAPRPYNSWKLLQNLQHLPRVVDLFDVKQGVRTGYNKAFLIKQEDLVDLPKKEQNYFRPAVVNKSIQYGFLKEIFYIFYPYGSRRLSSEQQLLEKLPSYYERFLLPAKQALLARASVNIEAWWELIRHRTWQEENTLPKIVSTYFGDAGSFAWDATGKFVIVQGFGWFPKQLKNDTVFSQRLGLAYLAVLNSSTFTELLSASSNHVGGGQWNLSKKFVDNIPIPNLFDEQVNHSLINELASIGEKIHAGLAIDEKKLTDLLEFIYGISNNT